MNSPLWHSLRAGHLLLPNVTIGLWLPQPAESRETRQSRMLVRKCPSDTCYITTERTPQAAVPCLANATALVPICVQASSEQSDAILVLYSSRRQIS